MKVRVTLEINLNGTSDEVHPDYAARLIDHGLTQTANNNPLVASWQTIEVTEVQNANA